MKCCNYSKLDLIRKGLLIEGGGNETIEFYASEIGAILEDEDIELYGEDDIVVDGPEPGETMEQLNRKTIEQPNEKRRKRKQEAAETVTVDSPAPSRSSESSKSRNLATSQSRNLALTPEQIRQGQSRVLRLIQQRTPPDIPTLVRACIDDGMTAGEIAALTGLGYFMIARCKTGAVTSTVADRFQELFAFPRKTAAQEEA